MKSGRLRGGALFDIYSGFWEPHEVTKLTRIEKFFVSLVVHPGDSGWTDTADIQV